MKLLSRFVSREEGQGYAEFLWVLPIFTIFIAGVMFFGQIFYCQLACDMASYDGARAAAEALLTGAGTYQGQIAAARTLEGFHMDPSPASISVYAPGEWERGREIYCRVTYNLSLGHLPFVGSFPSVFSPAFEVSSDTALRVESFRSWWE